MIAWITENMGTIVITLLLILIVGAIVFSMIRNKRKGKSSCSCGGSCAHCNMCAACRQMKQSK